MKALTECFTHAITSKDFEQLNPLRSTLVKLAYNICVQGEQHLSRLQLPTDPFQGQPPVIEELLKRLFGDWHAEIQLNFKQKLHSILDYLNHLIQQHQADQFIHFSGESPHLCGWYDCKQNKIFLNPMVKTCLVDFMGTLIHEITHQVNHSYDFFYSGSFIRNRKFCIDLNSAYQLAAIGAADQLTPERRRLFETRQLLEEGFSDHWRQNLYRWMALNSAETLPMAILALASVPAGAAEVILKSRKTILKIQSRFFSDEAVTTAPFRSPGPTPAVLCQPTLSKEPWSPMQDMVSSLTQLIAAKQLSAAEAVGQPGAPTIQARSPWLLIPSSTL